MKKLLSRSASIVTIMSLLTACGIEDHPKEIEFPDNVSSTPEPETPEPEVPAEFSEVTVTSLKALANFPIGVAVPAGTASNSLMSSSDRQDLVTQHFNQLTAENIMKMDAMHPAQGDFTWVHADELLSYADDNELTVHGHVLVWHSQIPDWMRNFDGDSTAWVAMMENHVTTIATRYAGRLETWDVVNEAFNEDGSYRGSADGDDSVWYTNIGESFIEKAFIAARAADADVDLYYNDYNISWNGAKLDGILAMAADFQARDIPINGIGFQVHVSATGPDKSTFARQLKKVVDLGLKVKITELDLRMNETKDKTFTSEVAELQKKRYFDLVSAYLETVPAAQRGGVSVWGLIDDDSWLEGFWGAVDWPLMFNDDYTPKPALQGFADALATEEVVIPDTPENILTNGDFEGGIGSWVSRGDPTVTLVTTEVHGGTNSALVEGRTATWQGISKDVVGLFTADHTYNVSAWAKLSDDASTVTPGMKLTLEIKYGVDTTEYLEMTAPVTVTAGDWVELTGTYTHMITTEANEANLYVEADDIAVDFYVDDISIVDDSAIVEEPVVEEEETPFFNTNFETGLDSWGPRGDATVTLVTTEVHGGINSALVEGRTATWQGISKDVVGLFIADETYSVSAWVKLSDDASTVTPGMKLTLEIKYGVDTTEYLEMTTPVTVTAGDWVQLTGTYTHMITTEANEANLYVEADDIAVDFYVDDIMVTLIEE